jgi:hypothetical protein
MIDNSEIENILDKLENMEDELLAVELLKEFNCASAELGRILLNLDSKLTNEEWISQCELAQKNLDNIREKINKL